MKQKTGYRRLLDAFVIGIVVFLPSGVFAIFNVPAPKCEECTKASPCLYQRPAGDGCNTCSETTWCIDGKWFTDGMVNCTLASCGLINGYEIPNPFQDPFTR